MSTERTGRHIRCRPAVSSCSRDKQRRTPVHDLRRLLRGFPALEKGVRLVKDDLQNLLIAAGTAVGVLQHVHQIIRGSFIKQERKIARFSNLDAALLSDGRLLLGLLRFDLLLHQLAARRG